MRNCLVVSNASSLTLDDGMLLSSGASTLLNCTVADNNNKVGISYKGGSVAVTNCIIWGHATNDLSNFPTNTAGVLLNVGYSLFAVPNTMDGISGCMTNNPQFVNTATNDYRLKTISPCIDKGLNDPSWMTGASDLIGAARIQNKIVDMGAYETYAKPARGTFIILR